MHKLWLKSRPHEKHPTKVQHRTPIRLTRKLSTYYWEERQRLSCVIAWRGEESTVKMTIADDFRSRNFSEPRKPRLTTTCLFHWQRVLSGIYGQWLVIFYAPCSQSSIPEWCVFSICAGHLCLKGLMHVRLGGEADRSTPEFKVMTIGSVVLRGRIHITKNGLNSNPRLQHG